MADIIDIEILPDGSIKVTTDKISAGNHRNADELVKLMASLMGGEVTTEEATKKRSHTHHVSEDRLKQ